MSDRPVINDAVMGLRQRIPAIAPCGIVLVKEVDAVKLLRRKPNWTTFVFFVLVACFVFGLAALISHVNPNTHKTAWIASSLFYLIFVVIAATHMVKVVMLSRQPLLVMKHNAVDIEVPTCGRTVDPLRVRGVRHRETRPTRTGLGKYTGWTRVSLLIDETPHERYELVVAVVRVILFGGDRGAKTVAEHLAQTLRVPIYHE